MPAIASSPRIQYVNPEPFFQISLVTYPEKKFRIESKYDLVNMLSDINLQMNFEFHHVCSELAQNMLEENNSGAITISSNKVVNVVKYKDKQECYDKSEKFIHGLTLAKQKECTGKTRKSHSSHAGRGLSSILRMGWKISYLIQDDQMTIEAIKS
mgnify:CR=1 FL=1